MSTFDLSEEVINWLQENGIRRVNTHSSARDLSDAHLVAELLHQNFPKLVNMLAYPRVHSTLAKKENWDFLKRNVLVKIGVKLNDEDLDNIVASKLGAIEKLLNQVYLALHKPEPNNNYIEVEYSNEAKPEGSQQGVVVNQHGTSCSMSSNIQISMGQHGTSAIRLEEVSRNGEIDVHEQADGEISKLSIKLSFHSDT